MAETRFGTFEELMDQIAPAMRPIATRLRQIVLLIHPDAVEVVRLGTRAATCGLGPKKMSEANCYVLPQRDRVNLCFFHGAELADPDGLLEGTGARMRDAKTRSLTAAESPMVRALIESALDERKATLGH